MIAITTIPPSTATEQNVVVEIKEGLGCAIVADSSFAPQSSLTFTMGTLQIMDGKTFVPINVTGMLVYKPAGKCGARTKLFNESFNVAFTSTTDNQVTITPSATVISNFSDVKCNRAHSYSMLTSLAIVIA